MEEPHECDVTMPCSQLLKTARWKKKKASVVLFTGSIFYQQMVQISLSYWSLIFSQSYSGWVLYMQGEWYLLECLFLEKYNILENIYIQGGDSRWYWENERLGESTSLVLPVEAQLGLTESNMEYHFINLFWPITADTQRVIFSHCNLSWHFTQVTANYRKWHQEFNIRSNLAPLYYIYANHNNCCHHVCLLYYKCITDACSHMITSLAFPKCLGGGETRYFSKENGYNWTALGRDWQAWGGALFNPVACDLSCMCVYICFQTFSVFLFLSLSHECPSSWCDAALSSWTLTYLMTLTQTFTDNRLFCFPSVDILKFMSLYTKLE